MASVFIAAFVTPNASYGLDWGSNGQDVIRRLVSSAKNSGKGTKVVLSVGASVADLDAFFSPIFWKVGGEGANSSAPLLHPLPTERPFRTLSSTP